MVSQVFLLRHHLDASKSNLFFDDPISSLDHMKRASIVVRIVGFAKYGQVMVFTHGIDFTIFLCKAARKPTLPYAMRGIENRRKSRPGYANLSHL